MPNILMTLFSRHRLTFVVAKHIPLISGLVLEGQLIARCCLSASRISNADPTFHIKANPL